jgi:hypothetical protein
MPFSMMSCPIAEPIVWNCEFIVDIAAASRVIMNTAV